MRVCGELSLGSVTVRLTDVLALGGNGVTYVGRSSTGVRIVAKIPVPFVTQGEALISGGDGEGFEEMVGGLRRESRWLDTLKKFELFPRKLFPSAEEVPILTIAQQRIMVPVIILEYRSEPSLREVFTSIRGASRVLRVAAGTGANEAAEIVAGITVGLLRGLTAILSAGGVYTDLAPDNVLTGPVGRPVVFLDAGAIVTAGTGSIVPVRRAMVPAAFEALAAQLPSLPDPEVQAVLVGMVAKLVAGLLTGAHNDDTDDPSPARAAARVPMALWLGELLARGMRHTGMPFRGLDDAAAFIESHTHAWNGGPMTLRKQFAES
jgi:serine/threonine protein kinase